MEFIFLFPVALALCLASLAMLPMRAVRLQLGELLAADPTTLAPATLANKVAVIIAAFTLSETLTVADLTLAAGNGLDPIAGATGAQLVALDPQSGAQIITLKAGTTSGWRWTTSGTFTSPITVTGLALTDNTGATLIAVLQFSNPITFTAAGYQLDADPLQMTFVQRPVT